VLGALLLASFEAVERIVRYAAARLQLNAASSFTVEVERLWIEKVAPTGIERC